MDQEARFGRPFPRGRLTAGLAAAALLAVAGFSIIGCGGQGGDVDEKSMVYGSPPAKVTTGEAPAADLYSGMGLSEAPEVKPAPTAPVQDVRIDVTHTAITVADGVTFTAWTFGGTVPGPVLHVRQGDRIRFAMTNRSDQTMSLTMPMPHAIDFHAAMVNPVDKYQPIAPGATLRFEWVANYPGVFMYHCSMPPMLQHLAYGMYGMVIVDPKEGYPTRPDREYAIVQSELYLTKSKGGGMEVDMDAVKRKAPTYVVFNGKPNRHVTEPLTAKPGERVRLYVLNAGPNGTSSFHVVGTLLDRVWIDGNPMNQMRGMQTVLLGASSGAIVEFVVPEAGIYTFVDHEFADAESGAMGHINALAP
ncbi:MAG TPA: multicopper oxidase domain-containing protein [Candidatus Eisenbacteria bacterium]